jgi:hypothetical protein
MISTEIMINLSKKIGCGWVNYPWLSWQEFYLPGLVDREGTIE